MFGGDIFEAISEEMDAIRDAENDALNKGDSDSTTSDSGASFLVGASTSKKTKVHDRSEIVRSNERLFGSVSLSFFQLCDELLIVLCLLLTSLRRQSKIRVKWLLFSFLSFVILLSTIERRK